MRITVMCLFTEQKKKKNHIDNYRWGERGGHGKHEWN